MPETLETSNPFNVEYPAGKFFVGREYQLRQLHELLSSLSRGIPSNLFVVGKGGEGKTSYLAKIVEESQKLGMLAFRCNIDLEQSAEDNIDSVMKALLREFEKQAHQEGLEDDWKSEKNSTFRTPQLKGIQSDELALDFERIHKMLNDANIKACVICIDEGQRIHPIALSAFKNALHLVKGSFMIVLSLLNHPDVSGVIGDIDNDTAGRDILDELASRSGDPGASRFFQNATLLGPFDSQMEAEECIKKRLENNIIQFTQPTISFITHIMRRHPHEMVKLTHRIYELAKNSSQIEVREKIVHEAFLIEYRKLIREAKELRENWSGFATEIYSELAKSDVGMTAMDITKKMYPTLKNAAFASVSIATQAELDRLCQTKFSKKLEGEVYYVPKPEFAYALKLTLDEP
jgi:hypothetical protein